MCKDLLRQTPLQAEDRDHLRQLLEPNTAGVLTSSFSIGVPVKPMKEALGRPSRRYLAKP
jgi:hypothetical protein